MLTSTWTDNRPPGLDAPRVVFRGVLVAEVDVAPRVAVQAEVDGDRVEDLLEPLDALARDEVLGLAQVVGRALQRVVRELIVVRAPLVAGAVGVEGEHALVDVAVLQPVDKGELARRVALVLRVVAIRLVRVDVVGDDGVVLGLGLPRQAVQVLPRAKGFVDDVEARVERIVPRPLPSPDRIMWSAGANRQRGGAGRGEGKRGGSRTSPPGIQSAACRPR